jgi:uncharacterized FlgJ-related protein
LNALTKLVISKQIYLKIKIKPSSSTDISKIKKDKIKNIFLKIINTKLIPSFK